MKRKKLFVCLATVLSLSSKQESFNAVKNSTNKMICGDKTEPCPVYIHSVRPRYI